MPKNGRIKHRAELSPVREVMAFIINYNRLTYLRQMVEWCQSHGLRPVVIDNASTYPPLLAYYSTNPCEVIRLNKNYGHTVAWSKAIRLPRERYIVTDPDLDMSGVPDDFLEVMNRGLDLYPAAPKCGLSLEINDLPSNEYTDFVKNWESDFWLRPLDGMYFDADVDTTFALYRAGNHSHGYKAIRTNRPYTARHYCWYYTDMESIPEDERHYYQTANDSASYKKHLIR